MGKWSRQREPGLLQEPANLGQLGPRLGDQPNFVALLVMTTLLLSPNGVQGSDVAVAAEERCQSLDHLRVYFCFRHWRILRAQS